MTDSNRIEIFCGADFGFLLLSSVKPGATDPADFTVIEANQRLAAIAGVAIPSSAPEYAPRISDWLNSEPLLAKKLAESLNSHASGEFVFFAKSVSQWFRVFINHLSDRNVCMFFHATSDRQLQTELLAKTAELETIYSSSPLMMCIIDEDQRPVYANQQLLSYIGRTFEEIRDTRACGAFGCINAKDAPEGCGFGSNCHNCLMNKAIQKIKKTGINQSNIPFFTTLELNGSPVKASLLANLAKIALPGRNLYSVIFQDVSDRQRMFQALKQSNELLEEAQKLGKTGHWEYDFATGSLFWSHYLYEIFAIAPETPGPDIKTMLSLVHPDDIDNYRALLDNCLKSRTGFVSEHRLLTGAGVTRFVFEHVRITSDESGNLAMAIGSILDLTDRKNLESEKQLVELALKDREQMLNAIFETANVGVVMLAPDGRYLLFNPWWQQQLGYSSEELQNMIFTDSAAENDRHAISESLQLALLGKTGSFSLEKCFLKKNGSSFWGNLSVAPMKSDTRVIGALIAVIVDITEQKNAEEALTKSKEQFELAIAGSNDGIWDWKIKTNELFLSQRWKEILGYTDAELPNSFDTFKILVHPEDWPRASRCIEKYIRNEIDAYDQHFRMLHKNGTIRWIRARGEAVRDENGRPLRMAGSHSDITEIKAVERVLARAKEIAESANQAKSNFLANMSHEMRTPLNGLVGFTELLKQTELSEDQQSLVNSTSLCAQTLLALINNILDISKIEAGHFDLLLTRTSIFELVDQVKEIVKPMVAQKGLELREIRAYEMPAFAMVDPDRLKQILLNLLGNAIKFTEKGFVELALSYEPSGPTKGAYHFSIRDSGIGIPDSHKEKLFQLFSQGDETINRRFGGTGLGLAISKLLVEKMGGRISFSSQKGLGSTFFFSLTAETLSEIPAPPRQQNTVEKPAQATHCNPGQKPVQILLADDIPNNRLLARLMISRLRANVKFLEAENGQIAVELFKNNPDIDMILMDVSMPVLDGRNAAVEIRNFQADSGRRVPIIAFTANATREEIEKDLLAGMDDCLIKPVTMQNLANFLDKHLEGLPDKKPEKAKPEPEKESFNRHEFQERVGSDPEVWAALLGGFLSDAEAILQSLAPLVTAQNHKECRNLAHALKGAATNISIKIMAELAREMEFAARDENPQLGEVFEKLNREWHEVKAILQHELAKLPPVTPEN
ncbi:MAG TPA: PAS domain S-box protein [Candidatus Rifleibacterium sp.]|nr:PAS domain S-box protein [Candidatus Rifleibacterium sp.]